MPSLDLKERHLKQIKSRRIQLSRIEEQIQSFRRGFPFVRLVRPCRRSDGITVIARREHGRLMKAFAEAADAGRVMKFVPASGAASRMFKLLEAFRGQIEQCAAEEALGRFGGEDRKRLTDFFSGLPRYAFFDDLRNVVSRAGLDLRTLAAQKKWREILSFLLTPKGLNCADTPKGLIPFHRYPAGGRTAFAEHLAEAVEYAKDRHNRVRIHFTVSNEHEAAVKAHLRDAGKAYAKKDLRFQITFSTQDASADTIAVDLDNKPFKDDDRNLVFRPGGHGALLKNLNDLRGDIVFVKNIDNVAPDSKKQDTYRYKKILGGCLVEIQNRVFDILDRLEEQRAQKKGDRHMKLTSDRLSPFFLKEAYEFAESSLGYAIPKKVRGALRRDQAKYLRELFHRPIRVCGMVENKGEPGGGPFWVKHEDVRESKQIVESSQVDMGDAGQRRIWMSSTHFNPVDLVLGVRDHKGKPFDLFKFRDPNTGFISKKSQGGRDLKALELPGLWNGSMAFWHTVFVEVPITTFAPVKTVFDLARKEHQT